MCDIQKNIDVRKLCIFPPHCCPIASLKVIFEQLKALLQLSRLGIVDRRLIDCMYTDQKSLLKGKPITNSPSRSYNYLSLTEEADKQTGATSVGGLG